MLAEGGATITGRVRSENGAPLPGVSVLVNGTPLGAATDEDGRYVFVVPAAQLTGKEEILSARRVGYKQVSVAITLSPGVVTHDFVLSTAAASLEGIVVTALGIERDKRSLSVPQTSVNAGGLTAAREPSIVNALAGKVPGVEVTNDVPQGGSPHRHSRRDFDHRQQSTALRRQRHSD